MRLEEPTGHDTQSAPGRVPQSLQRTGHDGPVITQLATSGRHSMPGRPLGAEEREEIFV